MIAADQPSSIVVRILDAEEWRIYRAIRLDALTEAPEAFASTLQRERDFGDADWRRRVAGSPVFVAWIDGEPSGVAATYEPPHAPGTQELVAMWVHPAARGHGVGDAIVAAVVNEARRLQARAVTLWVVRGNAVAEQLYRRHGFQPTTEVQPVPGDPCREELRMRLDLHPLT